MHILFACGGSGGHIHPALAIAQAFQDEFPDVTISFCGTPNGMERTLVTQAGFPFYAIPLQGLRRSLSLHNLKTAWLLLLSSHRAKKLLRQLKPDLVIGTGGYVCYPILRAATRASLPCALHESNAIPGLTTKRLSGKIPIVFTNFSTTSRFLPKADEVCCVGNPLRSAFVTQSQSTARAKLGITNSRTRVLLSFGGSLGAEHLNDAVLDFMQMQCSQKADVIHFHVCGSRDYDRCKQRYQSYGLEKSNRFHLLEFVYDMPTYLCACDAVICRAGAMTLSEVAICQKPSILIPSPYVTNNHQFHNAKVFSNAGASFLIEEKDLTASTLYRNITRIFADQKQYQAMQNAAGTLAKKDAAQKIITHLRKKFSL